MDQKGITIELKKLFNQHFAQLQTTLLENTQMLNTCSGAGAGSHWSRIGRTWRQGALAGGLAQQVPHSHGVLELIEHRCVHTVPVAVRVRPRMTLITLDVPAELLRYSILY